MKMKNVIIILIVTLLVQILVISFCDIEITKDAKRFDRMAENISKGLGFTEDGVNPSLLYPGAPLVFASVYYGFGHHPAAVRIFQAILFAILCVLVYRIGQLCFNERTGFISALICAFYPPLFILPSILLSEFLFTAGLGALVYFYVLSVRSGTNVRYVLTGVLSGAICYIRPTGLFIIFFLVFAAFFLMRNTKRFFRFAVISFTAFVIMILPITMRNYLYLGRLTPVAGTEYVKVTGQSEDEFDDIEKFLARQKERQFALVRDYYESAGIDVSESEIRQELKGTVGRLIPQDYSWRVKNVFDGLRRLYIGSYSDIYQIGIPLAFFLKDKRLISTYPGLFTWKLLLLFLSAFLSLTAAIGIMYGIRRFWQFLPVFVILFYNTLFYLTYALIWKTDLTTRYGLPVVPYIILFAVYGCVLIFNRLRGVNYA